MIQRKFIPLNDDVNKLMAFTPSLNLDWRNHQMIKSNPFQVETLDAINHLRDEGWKIKGSYENKGKNRKVVNQYIKLQHPDFSIMNNSKGTDAVAQMFVSNSCNGSSPLNLDLGAFRQVCSNGAVAFDSIGHTSIKHTIQGIESLGNIICGLNTKAQGVMQEFEKLKHIHLKPSEIKELVIKAATIRFGNFDFNPEQLLKIVREEDKGNDLYTLFNRIQENLTQTNRLHTYQGKAISGVNDMKEDIRINQKLSKLVYAYA